MQNIKFNLKISRVLSWNYIVSFFRGKNPVFDLSSLMITLFFKTLKKCEKFYKFQKWIYLLFLHFLHKCWPWDRKCMLKNEPKSTSNKQTFIKYRLEVLEVGSIYAFIKSKILKNKPRYFSLSHQYSPSYKGWSQRRARRIRLQEPI